MDAEQATLATRRLLLVPLADRHLGFEERLDADPSGTRLLRHGERTAAEVAVSHRKRTALGRGSGGLGLWVGVATTPDGSGDTPPATEEGAHPVVLLMLVPATPDTLRLLPDAVGHRVAEVGMQVERTAWGRGLATEALTALVAHGFDDLGLDRVVAGTMAVNAASRAALGRAGLREVATLEASADDHRPGAEQGEVVLALTREEWLRHG